jgi:hypothetical protein
LCAAIPLFSQETLFAGTDQGLWKIDRSAQTKIWDKAEVRKIIRAGDSWYLLTGAGIWAGSTPESLSGRNAGLPVKVIKNLENGQKTFTREIQELKDLEVHPTNPQILVTATKDAVYLTRDGGVSWKNIGISAATAGVKAVSVLDLPDATGQMRLTVFISHPIYGISWRQPDVPKTTWADLDNGLEQVPTIKWPDEVADLSAVARNGSVELYASQTFMPRIYRLDWANRTFTRVWTGPDFVDTIEGLAVSAKAALFTGPGSLREVPLPAAAAPVVTLSSPVTDWNITLDSVPGNLLSAWIPAARSGGRGDIALSELWLLHPEKQSGEYAAKARGKKGNYIPVHQVVTDSGFDAHLRTIKNNGLDMLVVDMKDDIGTLRYDAKDPLVLSKGRIGKGIQLEPFVKKAKENGVYLVARIVVFKDKSLASWGGGKYAVWDKSEQKPWQGYEYTVKKVEAVAGDNAAAAGSVTAGQGSLPPIPVPAPTTETVKKLYDEFWVDPYSEEVWEYNVAIAKELIARGFDEIQFDYIRFPTDGANLGNAAFRWQDPGMDKESALMSFLSYARREIKAPISIDIYGANGWYRTGARTGQDVELLSRYVDAICPMFYPSHFEQTFLAQKPAEERPYRVFYYGSYRNAVIAHGRSVIRPWAQAFYLNVSYDRAYYNADYVQKQVFGVRDSIDQGYTYWNNSGRYGDLRPDTGLAVPYPWSSPEAGENRIKPAFGAQ